ncbi:hypothetical protein GGR51DRAFT_575987 [Nemania sp. FL0031]|nr:hypothetical protein GGR51DRAFT_575987 [Nemania sp. FL0031]
MSSSQRQPQTNPEPNPQHRIPRKPVVPREPPANIIHPIPYRPLPTTVPNLEFALGPAPEPAPPRRPTREGGPLPRPQAIYIPNGSVFDIHSLPSIRTPSPQSARSAPNPQTHPLNSPLPPLPNDDGNDTRFLSAHQYWDQPSVEAHQQEHNYTHGRPASPGSDGTFEQAERAFADFDGAHFSPDAELEDSANFETLSASPIAPPRLRAAQTFEEMGIPHVVRRPTLLRRAATATRKAIVGAPKPPKLTPEEQRYRVARTIAEALQEYGQEQRRLGLAPPARDELSFPPQQQQEPAAAAAAAPRGTLRERAIRGELTHEELRELARSEHVYLTPRRSRHDFDDYALEDGIVARVSGRDDNGEYVFLGSDRRLYIGRHDLGRWARVIPTAEERVHYSEAREVARAYYMLCL